MSPQKNVNQDQKWKPEDYAYVSAGGNDDRDPISISNFLIQDEPTQCTLQSFLSEEHEGKYPQPYRTIEIDYTEDGTTIQYAVNSSSKRWFHLINRIQNDHPTLPVNVELVRSGTGFEVKYLGKILPD